MTALLHAFEHVSTILLLVLLVCLAVAAVKLRQFRMSECELERERRRQQARRPGWHPTDDDSEGDIHVQ